MPQSKFRPIAVYKSNLSALVTLPQHKIAESLNATGAYKYVQRRSVISCIRVSSERVFGDAFHVWIRGWLWPWS